MATLACSAALWDELTAALDDERETGGFILAGLARDGDEITLLARALLWVPDKGYLERDHRHLRIGSAAVVPALKAAADDAAVAVFVHTHPGAGPAPSRLDDAVDEALREPARIRTGQELYGSLILGGARGAERFSGRVWVDDRPLPIDRVRVAGPTLRLLGAGAEADSRVYDRQIRAFGREGQAALHALHAGVVGAGGTGSAVAELLTRLGVGRLTVIDDDQVTATNLTRIHESHADSVGVAKAEVAAAAAARIGLGTRVEPVVGRITELDAARALRHCDVIFGCTDDNRGRAILSRLAYWYLVPVIDMGFVVDTSEHGVRGLYGRVTVVSPGTACLFCRGRIDQAQLQAEALPPAERGRLAAEGYVAGLAEPDPSVGAYTTLVASFAVAELIDRLLLSAGDGPPPSELILLLHDRAISRTTAESAPGHYCLPGPAWGRGDEEPFLRQLWPASPRL